MLYGVSFLLFILLNIMVRNSPVCSRMKKKKIALSERVIWAHNRHLGISVYWSSVDISVQLQ